MAEKRERHLIKVTIREAEVHSDYDVAILQEGTLLLNAEDEFRTWELTRPLAIKVPKGYAKAYTEDDDGFTEA